MFNLVHMGRRRALPFVVAGIAVVGPAVALAAAPIASTQYSGKGKDCYNNTASGRYTDCIGRTRMSFRTSSNGKDILHFVGYYNYYCGAGTSSVVDKKIPVKSTGSFDVSGSYASYGPNHKRDGTIHAFIRGHFIDQGQKADVTYRAADHFSSSPPHSQPCGTLVKGVAAAQ